ncbi:MAG: CdaR family protein, partial [Acidobacteriota bacterium]
MLSRLDLPLLVLALVIAVAIKFAVHEKEQLFDRVVDAQVTYTPPGPDSVSYNLVEKVRVVVRGPDREISLLSPLTVGVVASVPEGRPGPRDIILEAGDVRFSVPGDFEVVSIDPNRFSIEVEPRLEKSLPVRVVLTGEPAAGSRHLGPIVRPARALVSGPVSHVERLADVVATVSLDGHARSFEDVVSLATADPLVQVVQPTLVTVEVPMEEPELTISFDPPADNPPAA